MTTAFEEALKKTLFGMNEGYEAAEKDLEQETAEAHLAISRVTGFARLALRRDDEAADGTVFTLILGLGPNLHPVEVGAFFVPVKGYPIKVAGSRGLLSHPSAVELSNRDSIKAYFNEMASNPDSPLVLRVALAMRMQRSVGK